MTDRTHQDLHDRIAKIEAQLAPKAPNLPPVQFKQVADGIDGGYDIFGGVDIRIGGDFVYVHINYDHRYTDNASRKLLADQIVGLLTAQPAPSGDVRDSARLDWLLSNIPWGDLPCVFGESLRWEKWDTAAWRIAIDAALWEDKP